MNFIKKLFKRKLAMSIAAITVVGAGYFGYDAATAKTAAPRYVTAEAAKGMLTVSVSGTGQISSSDQVDLKPGASGTIVSMPVTQGQNVIQGQLIAALDARAATRAVTDAQTNLETAKLNMQKALEPTDSLTVLQQENSLISARNSLQKTKDDLAKAYDDGFTNVSDAFLDLPGIMTGLQDILMGNNANGNQWNVDFYADSVKTFDERASDYREDAYQSYIAARKDYDKNFSDYKSASRASDPDDIAALIGETHATSLAIAAAVKDANNLIQFYKDKLTERNLRPIALADTQLSSLNGYTGTMNGNISALSSSSRAISTGKQSIEDSTRSLAEKQATIDKANAGADALDIRSLQISIDQKQNALQDAKDKLSDYCVRAPFGGVIAKVSAGKGDSASSGTVVATIISASQIAEVSLNEIDAAKVMTGQKATVSFDAIDGLSISGTVAEIDALGAVSQGVVSYGAKISLDTQDSRVKPGMTVSVAIITNVKTDVITIANSAVKAGADGSYVQIMENGKPTQRLIEAGLSNDSDTEIVSGLSEGDVVVTQTITATANTTTNKSTTTRSGSSAIPGFGGGGNVRVFRAD